jgi:hypothetical protein
LLVNIYRGLLAHARTLARPKARTIVSDRSRTPQTRGPIHRGLPPLDVLNDFPLALLLGPNGGYKPYVAISKRHPYGTCGPSVRS